MARKGGIASGVAKRQRKQLREVINEVLPMEVSDPELKAILESCGLKPTHEVAMGSIMDRPIRSLDLSQLSDAELEALADMCDERDALPSGH